MSKSSRDINKKQAGVGKQNGGAAQDGV